MLKVVGSGQAIISVGRGYNLQRLFNTKDKAATVHEIPQPKRENTSQVRTDS